MKVLVAYATFAGATAEVAEAVGQELAAGRSVEVQVRRAKEVAGLASYDAVVVGSAIRAGQVHPEALAFLEANAAALARVPVAYFVVCLTMKEPTEENRCTVAAYLDAVREKVPAVQPVEVGLFAGVMDPKKLPLVARLIMKAMKAPPGDFRDWDAIRAWAQSLRAKLVGVEAPGA